MKTNRTYVLGFCLIVAIGSHVVIAEENAFRHSDGSRIVHQFHFDERAEGNLEDLPRYWEPLRLPGFPRFTAGGFDHETGQSAPPSFHLASNGRNVAFQYAGPEMRVRENTDYHIVGHLRPDRLDTARACLAAYYVDRARRPLLESMVRSRWIGESHDQGQWVCVELFLPPAPAEAYSIGLSAWVMQEATWNPRSSAQRHLSMVNVNAGVWLDDIVVFALPFVSLSTTAPGNVLSPEDAPQLHVVLADQHDQGLVGELTIDDAAGRRIDTREIPATAESPATPTRIDLSAYAPGVYQAILHVRARERIIVTRTLRFAKLAPTLRFADSGARAFGVTLDPAQRAEPETEDRMVRRCGVQSLKLPVWSGLPDDPPLPAVKAANDRWLQVLLKDGFLLTGVFAGVPADLLRGESPYTRSLIDLLAEHPALWESSLGAVVAPYASTFRAWQLGGDHWHAPLGSEKLIKAVDQLSTSMRRFVTAPYLMAPVSAAMEATQPPPAFDQLAVLLPAEIQAAWTPLQLAPWREAFTGKLSVSVAPLPTDPFERSARLADWAQRLIAARHWGTETVFVPQPWTVRPSAHKPITEPMEEYMILRTLADMLGEARPAQHFMLSSTAQVYAFHTGGDTILAAWDSGAPAQGAVYPLQLGSANRQIDIWGVAQPLQRDDQDRQLVRLTNAQTLIDRVDGWLIDVYTALQLTPNFLESGQEADGVVLELGNHSPRALSGQVTLRAPRDWDISPRQFELNVVPGRSQKFMMDIRVAHNAPAGPNTLRAEIRFSDGLYMEVPLSVEFGLSDVKVQGMAWLDDGDLMIRHEIRSRSTHKLHFRGSALVPGRERQYRPITNLLPGEKQIVEYKFRDGAALIGALIRLELRETNDGPRTHTLELRVP